MPLTSIQAALAALIVTVGNAAVALGVIGVERATTLETTAVSVIAAAFLLANAVIHHGISIGGKS